MKISPITQHIIERIVMVAIIISVASFILSLFTNITTLMAILFSTGVITMSLLNCFKIFMIERTATRVSDMTRPEFGKGYVFLQYVLRYFLTAIVVGIIMLIMYLVSGVSPFISFNPENLSTDRPPIYEPMVIGLVVGLFTMKVGIMLSAKFISSEDAKAGTDKSIESE